MGNRQSAQSEEWQWKVPLDGIVEDDEAGIPSKQVIDTARRARILSSELPPFASTPVGGSPQQLHGLSSLAKKQSL